MSIDAMYTAASALQAFSNQLDLIGNNLANLNTTGFKGQSTSFQDIFYQTLQSASPLNSSSSSLNPIQIGTGVQLSSTETDFTQGTLTSSGSALNAGISGNGFFVVSNGSGDLYTRAGDFTISSNGQLVDVNTGDLVQRYGTVGESGGFQTKGSTDISMPANAASFSITSDGVIEATFSNGTTEPIAQLALANFANPAGLDRLGSNYFSASSSSGSAVVGAANSNGLGTVVGGTLEASNVNVSAQFTQLIIGQNGYDLNSKTVTTEDDVLETTSGIVPPAGSP